MHPAERLSATIARIALGNIAPARTNDAADNRHAMAILRRARAAPMRTPRRSAAIPMNGPNTNAAKLGKLPHMPLDRIVNPRPSVR